jgi:hypothetical protein
MTALSFCPHPAHAQRLSEHSIEERAQAMLCLTILVGPDRQNRLSKTTVRMVSKRHRGMSMMKGSGPRAGRVRQGHHLSASQ